MSQSNTLHPKSSDLEPSSKQEKVIVSIISAQSGEKQSKDSERRGSEDESRDICPKCEREVPIADEICAYCGGPYVEHFCCSGCGRLL